MIVDTMTPIKTKTTDAVVDLTCKDGHLHLLRFCHLALGSACYCVRENLSVRPSICTRSVRATPGDTIV